MNTSNIYLTTLIPELPRIYNSNLQAIKRYLDVIYDGTNGIIIVPVETTGRVKASTGEFVNVIVDNLTVKRQYTNLYENTTTIDKDYYNTYIGAVEEGRDASTTQGEDVSFTYIDVEQPYYKIDNVVDYAFKTSNLGQIVQPLFEVSTGDPFVIRLNDTDTLTVTAADSSGAWVKLICVGIPGVSASDNTWIVKEYGGTISF